MLRDPEVRCGQRGQDRVVITGALKRGENEVAEMAVVHGKHVRDVLHHENLRLERFQHSRKFEVKEISGVLQISGPYLAESLAGRAPEHQVHLTIDKLPLGGNAWMRVNQET